MHENVIESSIQTSSALQIQTSNGQPQNVQLGQPFILNGTTQLGQTGNLPLQLTLTQVWFGQSYDNLTADSGYKLLVVAMQAKNIGTNETGIPILTPEVTVDNGNVYSARNLPGTVLLSPTEVKDEAFAFEIPSTTTPVRITFYKVVPRVPLFVLGLSGISISTTTFTSLIAWDSHLL